MINDTHNPKLKSWVESANDPAADFPIQNLPLGVFRPSQADGPHIGAAIGDQVLHLATPGLLSALPQQIQAACATGSLNGLMALGRDAWSALRSHLSYLLRTETPANHGALVPQREVEMLLPAVIGDYTDFYASIHHATRVGSLFRPDNPLLPNYKYVPIAYHGRSSSIVLSGASIRRPCGQVRPDATKPPMFCPSAALDYELELGTFIGQPNTLGASIRIEDAAEHIFGHCLLNDWSARDIQNWESQPLGPFLAKNFATTISPWVVMSDALAPFRAAAQSRPAGDPAPLPYLDSEADRQSGAFEITLEVYLSSQDMRRRSMPPVMLSRGNFREMYWTLAQMVAHHASNGCNLRPGDLLGSGTISGTANDSAGCLLELTRRGADAIRLPSGELRRFLEDGDEVIFHAYCERDGFARIGFGECRGVIQSAMQPSAV